MCKRNIWSSKQLLCEDKYFFSLFVTHTQIAYKQMLLCITSRKINNLASQIDKLEDKFFFLHGLYIFFTFFNKQ